MGKMSLEIAFRTAEDLAATDAELLQAADVLVSWGHVDPACQVLNRLRANPTLAAQVGRLSAAAKQLQRSGVLTDLALMQESNGVIGGQHEAYVWRATQSRKVIVVFTGIDSRFWLSLMLLHAFLRRLQSHVIYLVDLRRMMFFDGLQTVAKGYHGLLRALRRTVKQLGADDIRVLAISVGGFAGLRYALDLQATSFLGMSIRTDFSERTSASMHPFFRREELRRAAPNMFVDLKPLLAKCRWPEKITLYCGEGNRVDRRHALHLADLPNVEIVMLESLASHNVISALLAKGTFEDVLRDFVCSKRVAGRGHE